VFPHGFWDSPLWKEAARAGLRQISKMVSEGNISGASRLATTPGVLKPSAAGSQISQIGRGSEGIATLVAHPEHGVAARKLYDPRGISSNDMIQRKEEVGRSLGDNPHFAKFLGSAQTPHGGGTMHFNEYVPSAQGPKRSLIPSKQEMAAREQVKQQTDAVGTSARQAISSTGYEGHDIRKGNMVQDARTGQHKVVDFLPGRTGEMGAMDSSKPGNIAVSPSGQHLFNRSQNQSTTRGMLGGMLGGNQIRNPATGGHMAGPTARPMGVRRNVGVSATDTLLSGNVGSSPRRPAPVGGPQPNKTQLEYGVGSGNAGPSTQVTPATSKPTASPATSVMAQGTPSPATSVSSPNAIRTVKPMAPSSDPMKSPATQVMSSAPPTTPQPTSTVVQHPPPPKQPRPVVGQVASQR
jgi:hypothetical protein